MFAGAVERPLFYVQPPRRTKLYRRLHQLARDKLFQELRRRLKRQWRALYRDSTTMGFERYEETLVRINNVGRDEEDRDLFGAELRTREARDLILRGEEREGEVDIPIFTWGPLTLTDGGDIQFDVGAAADDENTV